MSLPPPDPSLYDRPNQPWICGRADLGEPCPLGPSRRGACRTVCECIPVKQGDRWLCARAESRGGPCLDGPLPDGSCGIPLVSCQPRRTLLARRRLLVQMVFGLSLGAALFLLGGSWRSEVLSPGPLSSAHRTGGEQRCQTCHQSAGAGLADLLHAAFSGDHRLAQSMQCAACHPMGDAALHAHSILPSQLARLTSRSDSGAAGGTASWRTTLAQSVFGAPGDASGWLQCATCHQEHRGDQIDGTILSDAQCQTCHQRTFASFDVGHPEFGDYGCAQRTFIQFDHAAHYRRHFAENSGQRVACDRCHVPRGDAMGLRDFRTSCGACHAHQIEDDTAPGIALAAMPRADANVLKKIIGSWVRPSPQNATATDRAPPWMRLMLADDRRFVEAEARIAELDIVNLERANSAERRAAAAYLYFVDIWLHQLSRGDRTAARTRLAGVLGVSADDPLVSDLVAQMPWSLLAEAGGHWFPPAGPPAAAAAESRAADTVASGWYFDSDGLAVRYRPTGHADPILKDWIDAFCKALGGGQPALEESLRQFARPAAAGQCLKCHTAQRLADGQVTMRWNVREPQSEGRGFTRFSHRPHRTALGDRCGECHLLSQPAASPPTWHRYHPAFVDAVGLIELDGAPARTSGLAPMRRSDCIGCHRVSGVRQHCLTCHNYHITKFEPASSPSAASPGR